MRAALILYGRVGTFTMRAAQLKINESADIALWNISATSTFEHVHRTWAASGVHTDVFIHSWNVELRTAMDHFWTPVTSIYESQSPNKTFSRCALPKCQRTWWCISSMHSAMNLRKKWAREHRVEHHVAIVMRHDLMWFSDLPVLPVFHPVASPNVEQRIWLPISCLKCDKHSCEYTNQNSLWGRSCSKSRFCSMTIPIDWWWVSSIDVIDSFDVRDNYDAYLDQHLTINNAGITPHHMWGMYFHSINLTRSTTGLAGASPYHFDLGRNYRKRPSCAPIFMNETQKATKSHMVIQCPEHPTKHLFCVNSTIRVANAARATGSAFGKNLR